MKNPRTSASSSCCRRGSNFSAGRSKTHCRQSRCLMIDPPSHLRRFGGQGLGFEHVYRAGTSPTAPTLLLLHGTGGTEHDLISIGETIAPASGILSPRGQVLEGTMQRFFRPLSEGVFDLD